jgi:serine/threonine protein kinase
MTERDIFLAALEKDDPTERARYLDEAAGADSPLRRRIEALLRSLDQDADFMNVPVVEQLAGNGGGLDFLAPPEKPGSLGRLGHYHVLEVVGQGGMGMVFRALDDKLQRVVAIKALAPQFASISTARQRFVREARAAAAVTHDNVINIHAVEDAGPVPYMVMQFIDGPTLQQKLDSTGQLSLKEILRIGLQIAEGLAAAHRHGLIHRDVKPANILMENGIERVKLTDFGLARAGDDASLTQSGVVAGTPMYMSPEQAEGEPVDFRSDLFSLGSVLYAMCSGRPPFRAPTAVAVLKRVCEETPRPIREINPELPPWLEELVARLHAKAPAQRGASAQAVADLLAWHLAELQQGGTSRATGPQPFANLPHAESPVAPPRRTRRLSVIAAAVPLALLGGLGLGEATGVTNVRGTVIRLFSGEGTLVVEVDDPGVSVSMDGEELVIRGAGVREIRLKPGQYQLKAMKDGKFLRQELVTVARGRREVVRISREPTWTPGDPAPPDATAAKFKKSLVGHAQGVISVAYSPDGRLLASGDEVGEVRVWNVPDCTPRYVLPARERNVHVLVFSPDGKHLLTASDENGDINIWGAQTGKPAGALEGHTKGLYAVSFGPDGNTLVSGGFDATIRVWDFAARREVRAIPAPERQWIRSVVVSAGGKIAVTSGEKVFLLEPDGQLIKTFDTASALLCFSPDGRLLADTIWRDGRVTVWNVKTGEKVGAWQAHGGTVNGVAFSGDGRALATVGGDGAVRLWDVATHRGLAELRHEGHTYQLAFSPDGATLATTGLANRLVKLWDVSFLRAPRTPGDGN